MAFSIQITDERVDRDACEEIAVKGSIEIGSFREELLISLEVWSPADYLRQWKTGLDRILTADRSCLITSMRDLEVSDFINAWLLYREGEWVVFQNQVFIATEFKGEVSEECVYSLVPERETVTDDGQRISEWRVPVHDIKAATNSGLRASSGKD